MRTRMRGSGSRPNSFSISDTAAFQSDLSRYFWIALLIFVFSDNTGCISVASLIEVFKSRVPAHERQVHFADRAVALLPDDDFRHAPPAAQAFAVVRAFALVIDLVAVDEEYHVRVLLDGARLAEIGKHGTFVLAPRFHGAIELREGDHGNLKLFCERLERSRNVRYLLFPVVVPSPSAHELEVVHDDELEPMLGLQTPRLGAHLKHRYRRRIVDEDRRLGQPSGSQGELGPIGFGQIPCPEPVGIHPGLGAEHPEDKLFL